MDPVIKVGEIAPVFQLADLSGRTYRLDNSLNQIVVLNFWSAQCEWCERVDRELLIQMDQWKERVSLWCIASNSNESEGLIEEVAWQRGISPVLLDKKHKVGDMYGAQTTPHFYVVDEMGILRYQGSWDDITFRQRVATQAYVQQAVEALIQGKQPEISQTPPYGCALVRY